MAEAAARVIPFPRRRQSNKQAKKPFIALEEPQEFKPIYEEMIHERHGPEALAIAQRLFHVTYERLRAGNGPFLHDRMKAFACHRTPCIFANRKAQFPQVFALAERQAVAAFERLRGENPTEKTTVFESEKSTKSTAAAAPDIVSDLNPSSKGFRTETDNAPVVARSAEGCAPLPTREEAPPNHPASPEALSPTQPLESLPRTGSGVGPPERMSPQEMRARLAAVAADTLQAQRRRQHEKAAAERPQPTAAELAAQVEAKEYLASVRFGPDGRAHR